MKLPAANISSVWQFAGVVAKHNQANGNIRPGCLVLSDAQAYPHLRHVSCESPPDPSTSRPPPPSVAAGAFCCRRRPVQGPRPGGQATTARGPQGVLQCHREHKKGGPQQRACAETPSCGAGSKGGSSLRVWNHLGWQEGEESSGTVITMTDYLSCRSAGGVWKGLFRPGGDMWNGGEKRSCPLQESRSRFQVVLLGDASAEVCVVVGEHPKKPPGMAAECMAVKEEWLLQAVECYALPPRMEAYRL